VDEFVLHGQVLFLHFVGVEVNSEIRETNGKRLTTEKGRERLEGTEMRLVREQRAEEREQA
jgi:hypothetical protein